MQIDRQELYDRVWSTPLTKLAAEFGLSARGLAKLCGRHGVPVPGRGHWAKIRHGKATERPPLPDPWPVAQPPKRTQSEKRSSQHSMLVGAREHFEVGRKTSHGYLKPRKRLLVDLFVSKSGLPRALDLANDLFLVFEQRHHPVCIASRESAFLCPDIDEREKGGKLRYDAETWRPGRPTVVFVDDVAFGLTFLELSKDIEVQYLHGDWVPVTEARTRKARHSWDSDPWTTRKDMPSGRLALRAFSPYPYTHWQREWREAKPGDLSNKIRTIVRVLEREAPKVAQLVEKGRRQQERDRQRREANQREWRRQQEEWRRQERVNKSRQELRQIIDAWGAAKQVEEFFEDAEVRAASLVGEERDALIARLQKARELVGGIDALKRFTEWKSPDDR